MLNKIRYYLSILGPGILFAGAAVGGSHLVQSTRAGALFGYQLLPLILLINVLKYPFFELSQTYTITTGKNLLQAYFDYHKLLLVGYLIISLLSSFITIAAVSFVAASLLSFSVHQLFSTMTSLGIILLAGGVILFIGRFKRLDTSIKVLMSLLTLAVLAAGMMALNLNTPHRISTSPDMLSLSSLTFMIALMGWMPAPLDSCAWTSLWLQQKACTQSMNLRDALTDLRFGYGLTTVLALMFLSLGAEVMHYSGKHFSANGIAFSEQLIELFGTTLGMWSERIISLAALATMFSTTLTCLDAYPRSIAESLALLQNKPQHKPRNYWLMLVSLVLGAFIIVECFGHNLKQLIDIATILAFLTAPFIGLFTLVVTRRDHGRMLKFSRFITILSYSGLIFLALVSMAFVVLKLGF